MKSQVKISLFVLLALVILPVFAASQIAIPKLHQASLGKKSFFIEIVEDPSDRAKGLMNRESLPSDQGMLFIFPDEGYRTFWMKNTKIALSIAFFGKDRKLIQVLDMQPETPNNTPTASSSKPAMYALEMSQGWFSKNGIKVGAELKFSK